VNSLDFKNPLTDCGTKTTENRESNLWIFILGFIGGLIALLTPCVFPMIPLTVSFFTKGQKDKAKGKRDAFFMDFSFF
jgi:thiol:disulfide interchange protein DsbD